MTFFFRFGWKEGPLLYGISKSFKIFRDFIFKLKVFEF